MLRHYLAAGITLAALAGIAVILTLSHSPPPSTEDLAAPTEDTARIRALEAALRSIEARVGRIEESVAGPAGPRSPQDGDRLRRIEERVAALERAPRAERTAAPEVPKPKTAEQKMREDPNIRWISPDAPYMGGRIIRVGDDKTLRLSVGGMDRVPVGLEFWVFRDRDFVGRIRVTKVLPDQSVAVPAEGSQWAGFSRGDEVTTWKHKNLWSGAEIPMREERIPAIAGLVVKGWNPENQRMPLTLSVGDQDGVKEGYLFTIIRSGSIVGKVRITKVADDSSEALPDAGYGWSRIEPGDEARTRTE